MGFRPFHLLRELSGRAVADMTTLLLQQVAASLDGAGLARRAASGAVSAASAREEITVIEHKGDESRASLVITLARSFVTPFDREDMFRVSRSIDDVLDGLRDFVCELDMFHIFDERFVPVIDTVIDSLRLLDEALAGITDRDGDVGLRVLAVKKSCNDIRRSYDQQLVHLLDGEVTSEMLRRRELLRRLDVVGLRLGEAADALADAVIKRGM